MVGWICNTSLVLDASNYSPMSLPLLLATLLQFLLNTWYFQTFIFLSNGYELIELTDLN